MPKIVKEFLLSAFVFIIFLGYVVHDRLGLLGDEPQVIAPQRIPVSLTPTPAPTPSSPVIHSGDDNESVIPSTVPTTTPVATPGTQATTLFRDGNYTGQVADAYYGNVQVKAIISGGKISDVQFLQYPNDRRTSQEINNQAMPYLTSEAISAQSAQVDTISGATLTSAAFVKSLQTALDQAHT